MSEPTPAQSGPVPVGQRLHSLDAFRGFIMICLAAFSHNAFQGTYRNFRDTEYSSFWERLNYHFSHPEWAGWNRWSGVPFEDAWWVGCSFWDLIQPAFMFMVGVAMAYSYAKRQSLGHSFVRMFGHALWRSIVLVLIGIFLVYERQGLTLTNVLAQIGLGYTFLFLLWGRSPWVQLSAIVVILAGYWALFYFSSGSGLDFSTVTADENGVKSIAGVTEEWAKQHLAGIDPQWHKNANIAHRIDLWLLGGAGYEYNSGGYQTLNFIPSLANMIMGLMAGHLLRNYGFASFVKFLILLLGGALFLLIGWNLHLMGICPSIKRIWTPSFALYSGGWTLIMLAAFYFVVDIIRFRIWARPLIIVGMNSIAIYLMHMMIFGWTRDKLLLHFGGVGEWIGQTLFGQWYEPYLQPAQPLIISLAVAFIFWLILYYMYRRRIFIRI